MNKKHKQSCTAANYNKQSLILVSAVAECVSVSVFDSLVATCTGIKSYAIGLKICDLTAKIKKVQANS